MFLDKRAKPWERNREKRAFSLRKIKISLLAILEDDFKGHPLDLPHVLVAPKKWASQNSDLINVIKTSCKLYRLSMVNYGLNFDGNIVVSFRTLKDAATFKLFWIEDEA